MIYDNSKHIELRATKKILDFRHNRSYFFFFLTLMAVEAGATPQSPGLKKSMPPHKGTAAVAAHAKRSSSRRPAQSYNNPKGGTNNDGYYDDGYYDDGYYDDGYGYNDPNYTPPPKGGNQNYYNPPANNNNYGNNSGNYNNQPPTGGSNRSNNPASQPLGAADATVPPGTLINGAPSIGGQPGGVAGVAGNSGVKGPGCLKLDPDTGEGPDVVANFDFPDADIMEIAKTLARLTCLNFILDKDVKGRISIVSNSPITIGDAWKAFLTALDVNKYAIIPSGKYLRIIRAPDAIFKQNKVYTENKKAPDTDNLITRVVSLKYIGAEDVRRVFMNLISPTTKMVSYEQTNTLILTDTGSNLRKWVDLINLLDVEGYDERLEVIKIHNASAEDIARLVDQLLPNGPGGSSAAPAGGFSPAVPGGARFGLRGQRKTKQGGVISHIIADGRTNSLIVSANVKGLEQVKELIDKLDSKVTGNMGSNRVHVVYLQFADAEQVANTLNNITTGNMAKSSMSPGGIPGLPGLPGPGGSSGGQALFEGNVKIAADKPTNSIVVTASPSDYAVVRRVLSKLDIARDQVYVEAVIMEMALTKTFDFSVNVISPKNAIGFNPGNDLSNFLVNPLSVQGLALGFATGKEYSLSAPGQSTGVTVNTVNGLVKFLQQNSQANVLATPQILTLDNQEASIEIGESIPVPTTTTVQGVGAQSGFTMQKASLKFKIKPQINKSSNFVKLEIDQQMEDFVQRALPKAVQDSAYATTSRQSKTVVLAQDKDTIALGGLIRDNISESTVKVPLLGDIPILGWLFKKKSTTSQKSNLVVFITPRIIKQYSSIRGVLDRKIEERDQFLKDYNGGDDPYNREKMRMINELPTLSELNQNATPVNQDSESIGIDDEDNEKTSYEQTETPHRVSAVRK